jgi:type VI secretion system secreted protein VgrG
MKIDDDHPRYFNGFITRMQQSDPMGRFEPWRRSSPGCIRAPRSQQGLPEEERRHQTEVLDAYSTDYEWRLIAASLYPKLDYCIQYQESDFDFVSRLLEHFGIYYFRAHDSKHTLVLIDAMAKHKSKPIKDPISWGNTMKYSWTATNWRVGQEARSVKTVVHRLRRRPPRSRARQGQGNDRQARRFEV